MTKLLTNVPRTLDASNIDQAISDYEEELSKAPAALQAENALELMTSLKREQLEAGLYPGLTLFEAANRIMTDLTILFGVRKLLSNEVDGISFPSFTVELGNENSQDYDITAEHDGQLQINDLKSYLTCVFTKYENLS
jgi:hypothetical protein